MYAFFGKGFAYVGTRFFYVSEALLAVGMVALLTSRKVSLLFRTPIGLTMLVFWAWQIVRAVPYIGQYGIDVARDSMLWGYAAFAWIIAATIVAAPNLIERLIERYLRFVPWYLIFGPVALLVCLFLGAQLPTWSGTGVPLVLIKMDEYEAHLAGIAAFAIAGLKSPGWWLPVVALTAMLGIPSRGGLAGFIVAFMVAAVLARRGRALLLPLSVMAVLFVAVALNVHITLPGSDREISASQFFDDLGSTVSSDVESSNLEGTKEWRIVWWQEIWDYSVRGPYFWTGKGYGINLAVDDGIVDENYEGIILRSPHNSHLSFLARSGVPGFLLWITLQLTWLTIMLTSLRKARNSGKSRWAGLFVWIISYWAAFMTAASFDVYFENPMAAIPFWTVFGLGWGAQIIYNRDRAGVSQITWTRVGTPQQR
jgi:hypothetical protein